MTPKLTRRIGRTSSPGGGATPESGARVLVGFFLASEVVNHPPGRLHKGNPPILHGGHPAGAQVALLMARTASRGLPGPSGERLGGCARSIVPKNIFRGLGSSLQKQRWKGGATSAASRGGDWSRVNRRQRVGGPLKVRGKAADTGRRVSGGRKLVLGSVWSAPAQVWMYFLGLLVLTTVPKTSPCGDWTPWLPRYQGWGLFEALLGYLFGAAFHLGSMGDW